MSEACQIPLEGLTNIVTATEDLISGLKDEVQKNLQTIAEDGKKSSK